MQTATISAAEKRRISRMNMSLPLRVEGYINTVEKWEEISRLRDVSAFGVGFNLKRPVKRGRLVKMTIPLPRKLRCYDFSEAQYMIWGIVRRCVAIGLNTQSESYAIGIAFIGKHPPNSYFDDPAKIYEISSREDKGFWQLMEAPKMPDESHLPKDYRRHSRYPIPVALTLELLDENRRVIASENSVTENISLSGASVFCSLPIEVGSFIRVKSEQYNASIIAIVRGKRLGSDNIPRMHLEFIDRFFPLEGIE